VTITEKQAAEQAAEQAALRRVAEAVARGAEPEEVFPLVASEAARLLGAEAGVVWRFEGAGSIVMGVSGPRTARLGTSFPTDGEGAVARVARTGVTARARYRDLDGDDPTRARVERLGYRFGVAAPVSVDGRLWGAVLAARAGSRDFGGDAEERLSSFAELVGVAIANADARTRLQRRVSEHAAFARIATAVAGSAPSDEVFALVAQEVATLLQLEVGAVARFAGGVAELVAGWSAPGVEFPGGGRLERIPLDDGGVLARVHAGNAPARVDDYRRLGGRVAQTAARAQVVSSVAAPVRVGGAVWGAVVATASREGVIPADAEERLGRLADLVSMAIASADHRAELESRAATDPLTGLPNHRTFHDRLREELDRARRHRRRLALVVIDIDHFKTINDRHGHHVGDEVLVEMARRLESQARAGDLLARVGGEEFAWILPEADDLDGWQAADRARAEIADAAFATVGSVTISAGVSDTTSAGDPVQLYQQADGALYWAKAHGRNVCFRHTGEMFSLLSQEEQAEHLERTRAIDTIRALARAVDAKDPSTRGHSERVADFAVQLATAAGWPVHRAALLRDAGLVHDVGKIGVPDEILLQPSGLNREQREQIALHPTLGAQIASGALELEQVAWIRSHHERFDGLGYPDALAGDAIPEGARILALAEAWDAMTTQRGYAAARAADDAVIECVRLAGSQFCPAAVAALERLAAAGLTSEEGSARP